MCPQCDNDLIVLILLFQISHLNFIISRPLLCRVTGISLHYFWFTAFLIMSFISIELLYRFSDIGKPWMMKNGKNKKKVKYCWLVSFVFILVPVSLDLFSDFSVKYASSRGICFIEPHWYIVVFFIGPTLFFISINLLCLLATIYNINKSTVPSDLDNSAMADRSMAKIFVKISALMGVTWLLALLPYITGIKELWYVFIIVNGSQGVCIFFSSGIIQHIRKIFRSGRPTSQLTSELNNTGNEQISNG